VRDFLAELRRRRWSLAFRAGMAAGRRTGGVVPELRGGVPPIVVHAVALQLRRAADELELDGTPERGPWSRTCYRGMARGLRLASSILLDDVLGSAISDERGQDDA